MSSSPSNNRPDLKLNFPGQVEEDTERRSAVDSCVHEHPGTGNDRAIEPEKQFRVRSNNRLKKLASLASICLAVSLGVLKLAASIYTGSLAILSSMVDSVADLVSSMITFIAIRFSSQPASAQHRYGYGKAEALSALFQAAFVLASAFFVIYEGINRVLHPQEIVEMGWGLAVMIISLVATACLIAFQKYVIKKTNSLAVSADSLHYVVDLATNASIIASLIMVKVFNIYWFDTLAAIGIAVYLLHNAYELAVDAIGMLMDREIDNTIRQDVENIVMSCPDIKGIHDLRTRDMGGIYMLEFHLELDGDLSLQKAHILSHLVEDRIKETYPQSEVVIHQEPTGIKDDRLDDKLETV